MKAALRQEQRWVRKYNRAMDRAFRHWVNCRLIEGASNPRIPTNILNVRACVRHYRHACKIERNHGLTIIDTAAIPAEDQGHVEPDYDHAIDSLTHFCNYEDSLKSNL